MSEFKRQIINPSDAKVDANHLKINGVFLRGEISPFDIPKEMIVNYSDESRTFICDIIYLTEESLTKEFIMDNNESSLFFHFGKTSGKLYKIEIENIDKDKIPNITIQVDHALEQKIDKKKKNFGFEIVPSILNLMSAKKAIQKTHIFDSFVTA